MIYYLNELTALVAVPLLLLCFRGFWPHMWRLWKTDAQKDRALAAMLGMVMLVDVKGVIRMAYWDLWRSYQTGGLQSLDGTLINSGMNMIASVAALAGLMALFYSIPDDERHKYNWFTAPFYPGPCWWMK